MEINKINYISLGPNCFTAANLNMLNLRKGALPFDWLSTPHEKGLRYIINNIKNNWRFFLYNIKKNKDNIYHAEKYPDTLFPHVKNFAKNEHEFSHLINYNFCEHKNSIKTTQLDKFRRRCVRFSNIINNINIKNIYFYNITPIIFKNKHKFNTIIEDIKELLSYSKTPYKFILYMIIEDKEKFKNIQNKINDFIFFTLYYVDRAKNSDFGNCDDFQKMIDNVIAYL